MRSLFTGLLFSLSIAAPVAVASTNSSSPAAIPSSPQIVGKNIPRLDLVGYSTETAPLLSPMDNNSPIDRSAADAPQNVSVEAVPTPTAVASGMMVLGGLAAVRIIRRLRFA